jgi:hypothetical protein
MLNFISTLTLRFGAVDTSILLASGVIYFVLARRFGGGRATPLKGPPRKNFLFGWMPYLMRVQDIGAVYEEWAHEYGSVFAVPTALGSRNVVLADPKALTHFSAKETYGYVHSPQNKRSLAQLIGRGLLWADGDSHKRCVLMLSDKYVFLTQANIVQAAQGTEPGVQQCVHQELDPNFLRLGV